ncbi:hypothetical protein PAHAL_4G286800 [Panicum hallii]|uniref:WRC domain-containing protein n=1 Tax=Panicum hallii TaxID=206008 RepID=A0A2S3HKX6_9POAL|nr:uncharacterized protein LOC112890580 [Panicum hallii]PAN25252.1 hypothetical protein PAHAL_4G286800 [Panicum hallii]
MRIRRRPQPALQLGSDPTTSTTAPQTPQRSAARSRGWLGAAGGGEDREAKLLHAGADLGHKSGVARRLALPQDDDNVVADRGGRSMGGAQQHGVGAGDGGHRRFGAVSNGHRSTEQKDGVARAGGVGGKAEPEAKAKAEERAASNGALQLALVPAVAVSGSNGGGGAKKRRGPAVLLEGSRCSRVNGRGWRCSQPTLVGYSLCEHHLGKGRMRSAAAAAAAAAARGRLGRTEHGARTTVPAAVGAASMVTITAAPPPRAEAPPSLPPC